MDFNQLPEYFDPWEEKFSQFYRSCDEFKLTKLEATLNFISNIKEVDKFILDLIVINWQIV